MKKLLVATAFLFVIGIVSCGNTQSMSINTDKAKDFF